MEKKIEIRTWKCREATLVPGYGIIRPGSTLDIAEGSEPAEVKLNFDCLTPSQVNEIDSQKFDDNDLTFRAKIEKLKDMKVKIPRGCTKAQIDELFSEFVAKVELPDIVS